MKDLIPIIEKMLDSIKKYAINDNDLRLHLNLNNYFYPRVLKFVKNTDFTIYGKILKKYNNNCFKLVTFIYVDQEKLGREKKIAEEKYGENNCNYFINLEPAILVVEVMLGGFNSNIIGAYDFYHSGNTQKFYFSNLKQRNAFVNDIKSMENIEILRNEFNDGPPL
jgi:hypothetical protein